MSSRNDELTPERVELTPNEIELVSGGQIGTLTTYAPSTRAPADGSGSGGGGSSGGGGGGGGGGGWVTN